MHEPEDVIYEAQVAATTMPKLRIRIVAGSPDPTVMLVPEGQEPIVMDWLGFEYLLRQLEDAYEAIEDSD